MNPVNFKLVTVICEPVLESSILEMSQELGTTGYTVTEVKGQGSGEKSSGEIPDSKLKIEFVTDPLVATKLMKSLAETYFENYSVITYAIDISVFRTAKFAQK